MGRKKLPPEQLVYDEAKAEEVKAIIREAKWRIVEALPEDLRETRAAMKRVFKARAAKRREAKGQRQHHMVELLLTGHTQAEIARIVGQSSMNVSNALKPIWPFSHPGRDNRYVIATISPELVENLDAVAKRLGLSRMRAAGKILAAVLEEDGVVARRTLGIKGPDHE